jgi:hypothetical protein
MKIDIGPVSGGRLQLEVLEDATIGAIKSELAGAWQTDPNTLILYLNACRLHDA